MVSFTQKDCYRIEDLMEILRLLRGEGGCPWDREQTHQSIRMEFIEETYEAVEAIDTNDIPLMREELGDVLLQVAFHCQIEREQGSFTFDDVCDEVCKSSSSGTPCVRGVESVGYGGCAQELGQDQAGKEAKSPIRTR